MHPRLGNYLQLSKNYKMSAENIACIVMVFIINNKMRVTFNRASPYSSTIFLKMVNIFITEHLFRHLIVTSQLN